MTTDSKAKYTPGPWNPGWGDGLSGARVAPTVYLDNSGCQQLPIRSGRSAVAWILCDQNDSLANADARLIAAAPDQHEALQATQLLLERLGLESSDEYQRNAAAIAKALGGTA